MHSWEEYNEGMLFPLHHIRKLLILTYSTTGDVNLEHLANLPSGVYGILDCKLTIFLLVITKYFGEML